MKNLIIFVLFQAILGMLSAIDTDFFKKCYQPLGNLMDNIALLNSSVNFVIYYFMSRQFRKTFVETFRLTWCKCPGLGKPDTPQGPGPNKNRARSARGAPGTGASRRHNHELKPLIAHQNPLATAQENEQPEAAKGNTPEGQAKNGPEPEGAQPQPGPSNEANGHRYVLKRTSEPEEQV